MTSWHTTVKQIIRMVDNTHLHTHHMLLLTPSKQEKFKKICMHSPWSVLQWRKIWMTLMILLEVGEIDPPQKNTLRPSIKLDVLPPHNLCCPGTDQLDKLPLKLRRFQKLEKMPKTFPRQTANVTKQNCLPPLHSVIW